MAGVLAARLPRVTPPSTEQSARGALSRPVHALVQAGTLAVAALLVIGVLQTRLVDQISSAVDGFVTEVATVGDKAKRKPAPVQPRERTSPGNGARERRGGGADTRAGRGDRGKGSEKRAGQSRGRRDNARDRGRRQSDNARPARRGSSREPGRR